MNELFLINELIENLEKMQEKIQDVIEKLSEEDDLLDFEEERFFSHFEIKANGEAFEEIYSFFKESEHKSCLVLCANYIRSIEYTYGELLLCSKGGFKLSVTDIPDKEGAIKEAMNKAMRELRALVRFHECELSRTESGK